MTIEDDLKSRISELELKLDNKDREIAEYLDKIDQLEEMIIRLESFIPKESLKESKKETKKKRDSKSIKHRINKPQSQLLAFQLKEKEKEIRELKNKMGFLRKEKINIQHELEKFTKERNNSTVIRIEEKKEPFETLVKELQAKINKQQIIINQLREKLNKEEIDKEKVDKEVIDSLNLKISKLKKKENVVNYVGESKVKDSEKESLKKELQEKLLKAKTKKEVKSIEKKLKKIEKNRKKEFVKEHDSETEKVKEAQKELPSMQPSGQTGAKLPGLTDELQKKLNKAKNEIQMLQEELMRYKKKEKKILEQEQNSEDLIINNLRSKLETVDLLTKSVPTENPQIALRWKELKNIIDDLNKQNIEQRIEISELRKKLS